MNASNNWLKVTNIIDAQYAEKEIGLKIINIYICDIIMII